MLTAAFPFTLFFFFAYNSANGQIGNHTEMYLYYATNVFFKQQIQVRNSGINWILNQANALV